MRLFYDFQTPWSPKRKIQSKLNQFFGYERISLTCDFSLSLDYSYELLERLFHSWLLSLKGSQFIAVWFTFKMGWDALELLYYLRVFHWAELLGPRKSSYEVDLALAWNVSSSSMQMSNQGSEQPVFRHFLAICRTSIFDFLSTTPLRRRWMMA